MKKHRKKNNIIKSLKFFKDVKYQLIVIALFNIALGIIGFISPIIEANLITSITNTLINQNKVVQNQTQMQNNTNNNSHVQHGKIMIYR